MKISLDILTILILLNLCNSCQFEKKSVLHPKNETLNSYWEQDSIFQNVLFPKIGLHQITAMHNTEFVDIYRIQLESSMIDPIYRDVFTLYQKSNKIYLEIKSVSRPHSEILNFLNNNEIDSFKVIFNDKKQISVSDYRNLKSLLKTTEFYDLKTNGDVGIDGRNVIFESLEYVSPNNLKYHKIGRNAPKNYEAAFQIEQYFYNLQQKYWNK